MAPYTTQLFQQVGIITKIIVLLKITTLVLNPPIWSFYCDQCELMQSFFSFFCVECIVMDKTNLATFTA